MKKLSKPVSTWIAVGLIALVGLALASLIIFSNQGSYLSVINNILPIEKKIGPIQNIFPVNEPESSVIQGPTVGQSVNQGETDIDLRNLPTSKPFNKEDFRCQTAADCYDERGLPIGFCSVPCHLPPKCIDGYCYQESSPGLK